MAGQNVCFKCATDAFLSGLIRRKGISTSCSLCATQRKCISLSDIVSRVESILHDYICAPDVHRMVRSDGSFESLPGKGIEYWVSHIFRGNEGAPIVDAVCANLTGYGNQKGYLKKAFTHHALGQKWGEFQEGIRHKSRFFNEDAKQFLDWLFHGVHGYSAGCEEHAVVRLFTPENAASIFRARSCMTLQSKAEIAADPARKLAAPPKRLASDGRMNAAGVPVFYGAFDRETCISELRPPVGCTVVSGEFRLNDEVRVLDFGRFEKADLGPEPSFFDPGYYVKSGRREFLKYLHDEITLPVLPGAEADYLTSQVIAEYLATCCKPRIDGVIFKSVQNPSGSNIVLFSHVACAETGLRWSLNGAQGISGAKSSQKPSIEYVIDSFREHPIRSVKYIEDEPAPDAKDIVWLF